MAEPKTAPETAPAKLPSPADEVKIELRNTVTDTVANLQILKNQLITEGVSDENAPNVKAEIEELTKVFEGKKAEIRFITKTELQQLVSAIKDTATEGQIEKLEGKLEVSTEGELIYNEVVANGDTTPPETTPDANSTDTVPNPAEIEQALANTPTTGEEKPKNGLENMMKWLGGIMGGLGAAFQTLMKYFNQAKEMFASSIAGFENVDQYKNFNTLKSAIGNPEMSAKLETLDAQQKKEIISALQGVVGEGKQVSSQKLKKLFERKPFSSNAEGPELANALIDHLEKNKLEYGYEEPVLTPEQEKEKAEKEAEEKRKSFIDSVNKEMIDNKLFINQIIETSIVDKKTYPDFSNPANMKSYGSPKPWKEYTLWEIYNMKDGVDTSKTGEQKVRIINAVVEYYNSVPEEQRGQVQSQTLASAMGITEASPHTVETVSIESIREKARVLNKKENTSLAEQTSIAQLYRNNPDEFILDSATDGLPVFGGQTITRDLFTKNLRDLGIVIPEGTNYEKINGVYKKYSSGSTLSANDRKFS